MEIGERLKLITPQSHWLAQGLERICRLLREMGTRMKTIFNLGNTTRQQLLTQTEDKGGKKTGEVERREAVCCFSVSFII